MTDLAERKVANILTTWKSDICWMVWNGTETLAECPLNIAKEIIPIIEQEIKKELEKYQYKSSSLMPITITKGYIVILPETWQAFFERRGIK